MRPLTLAWLALCLFACSTEVVELLPDQAPPRDAAVDVSADRQQSPDTRRTPDSAQPDKPPPCVCRYSNCRDDPTCQSQIGSGSSCQLGWCTGARPGACTASTASSVCGLAQDWTCATSATSQTPCP